MDNNDEENQVWKGIFADRLDHTLGLDGAMDGAMDGAKGLSLEEELDDMLKLLKSNTK